MSQLTVFEILKRAWGDDPPAAALFADNMWYKAEAYIGSEYAGRNLYDDGLTPIYVSDNPVLNAQHLVFEAAKAYKYGLPYHAALASVTTAPAERLGLGKRLGKIKEGFDADVVLWDSDPLSVGATPIQVWIDGTAQYEDPVRLEKSYDGPMDPTKVMATNAKEPLAVTDNVIFTGVTKVLIDTDLTDVDIDNPVNVVIRNGKVACIGTCNSAMEIAAKAHGPIINLENGYITPSFTAFGSTLGLNAIDSDSSTDNGADGYFFSRGVDGLALGTEKLHVSHRYGVTKAISAPKFASGGTHHGTSVGFKTGASTAREPGAVFARDAALHYTLDPSAKRGDGGPPSMSGAVGELRRKLMKAVPCLLSGADTTNDDEFPEDAFLCQVIKGKMALAITVHSADTIAAILDVKDAVEEAIFNLGNAERETKLRIVIVGGAEAHLLADELSNTDVGVILAPLLSFATSWDQRRALTGAPLTNGTAIDALLKAGVTTAIGLEEDWIVRDLGLLAGIAYKNSGGRLGEKEAMDLIGRNIYNMLGLKETNQLKDFVIHEGSPLKINSRVMAVGDGFGKVYLH